MSRHRLEPVRPRYGRLMAALAALAVTFVALLGGIGLLPVDDGLSPAEASLASAGQSDDLSDGRDPGAADQSAAVGDDQAGEPDDAPADDASDDPADESADSGPASTPAPSETPAEDGPGVATVVPAKHRSYPLPADSGSGRRVVFDQSQQRVWLVSRSGDVLRTYLVSGSVSDNLDPGSYQVYSRSSRAFGIDGASTMRWFVRFTAGDSAAIGFHDIPEEAGLPVQNLSQLGTPQSHGCIRQREPDARAMWKFAPLETWVYVVA